MPRVNREVELQTIKDSLERFRSPDALSDPGEPYYKPAGFVVENGTLVSGHPDQMAESEASFIITKFLKGAINRIQPGTIVLSRLYDIPIDLPGLEVNDIENGVNPTSESVRKIGRITLTSLNYKPIKSFSHKTHDGYFYTNKSGKAAATDGIKKYLDTPDEIVTDNDGLKYVSSQIFDARYKFPDSPISSDHLTNVYSSYKSNPRIGL